MKFMSFVLFAFFAVANTAFAQTSEPNASMPDSSSSATDWIAGLSLDECRSQLSVCLERLGAEDQARMELLRQLAERMGFRSVDDMLAAECRQRRGTWSGGQCVCAEPNHWFTEQTKECCVANTSAYSRRLRACEDSGGVFSCRGGCNCPFGMELTDEGRCQGERATRLEVAELRARNRDLQAQNADLRNQIAALQAERDRLRDELEAARARGDELATRVAELESQLRSVESQLQNLRTVLIQCEDEDVRQAATAITPGETIPGTRESAAAVAAESTRGSDLAPSAPSTEPTEPQEDEDGWYCSRGAWEGFVCFGLPVIGATAIALGAACAADWCRDTVIVQ